MKTVSPGLEKLQMGFSRCLGLPVAPGEEELKGRHVQKQEAHRKQRGNKQERARGFLAPPVDGA